MPRVRLVVRPVGVSRSGRLRVRIFTGPDASEQYSIDPSRITALYRVNQDGLYNVYIVEYETDNPDFELYRRSSEYAASLIPRAKRVDSVRFVETRYDRYSDMETEIYYRLWPGGVERVCKQVIQIDADDYCVVYTTCPIPPGSEDDVPFCDDY